MNPRLAKINRIILSIGHGGIGGEKSDPGAIDAKTGAKENEVAKCIVTRLAGHLTANGFTVLMIPDYSLSRSISLVNEIGKATTDWALELHKDANANFKPLSQTNMMGIYYHPPSRGSKEIAGEMVAFMIAAGANTRSWSRPDTESNHGSLGWIRHPKMLSHIVEAGFIQDTNTDADNEKYAVFIAKAICGMFGKTYHA
ncbi:MAG: N-acetylmuramoyl-L-alanine amidase [Bacteroidota bacterium]|nr:N-acetylmuramoyl-L-alanine amidase [Bacteroidota bacterium]